MEFHRIPTQVTTYESRIIGKFTAKQFTYLAIGGILVFLVGTSPLSKSAKLPLLFVIIGTTALFALVNFEGRSTDIWLVQFLKAVLSPTQRVWLKKEEAPEYLFPTYYVPRKRIPHPKKTREELEHFLSFWKGKKEEKFLTPHEEEFLQKIKKLK